MKPIRASDIGTYIYCRRAWKYRINGQPSINQAEMAAGTELHRRHGQKVITASLMRLLGFVLLLSACVTLTALGLLQFLEK